MTLFQTSTKRTKNQQYKILTSDGNGKFQYSAILSGSASGSIVNVPIDNQYDMSNVINQRSPIAIKLYASGSRGIVCNNVSSTVSIFDTSTKTLVATVPVGNGPRDVVVTPDGTKAVVVNQYSADATIVDLTNNTVSGTVAVGNTPYFASITPDGTKAVVANYGSASATVINLSNLTTGTVACGTNPYGVAITPDGTKALVTNTGNSTISVINLSGSYGSLSGTVSGSLLKSPEYITVTPDGTKALVTNAGVINNSDTKSIAVFNLSGSVYQSGSYVMGGASGRHVVATPDSSKFICVAPASRTASVYSMTGSNTPPVMPCVADSYDSLLLHMDGTGTTFTDSSQNAFAITNPGGMTYTNSAGYYVLGTSSANFNGLSTSYLKVTNANIPSKFAFGTGDFTIECYLYMSSLPSTSNYWIMGWGADNANPGMDFYITPTNIVCSPESYGTNVINTVHGMRANNWYHVALCRSGNNLNLFINGVLKQSVAYTGTVYAVPTTGNNANSIAIGASEPYATYATGFFNGFIDELRVSKGIARYAASGTPTVVPTGYNPTRVACNNNVALVASNSGITKINLSSLTSKTVPCVGTGFSANNTFEMKADGTTAFFNSSNKVTIFDVANETASYSTPYIEMGDYSYLWGTKVNREGTKVFFDRSYTSLDLTKNAELPVIIPEIVHDGVYDISSNGSLAVCAGYDTSGYLSSYYVVDVSSNSILSSGSLGAGYTATCIKISPNDSKAVAYAYSGSSYTARVINLVSFAATSITVGSYQVFNAAFTPDSTKVWGNSTIIDTTTNAISSYSGSGAIAISPDGTRAITGTGGSTVTVINTSTLATVTTVTCGPGAGYQAGSIAFTPDGTKAVVGNYYGQGVTIIRTSDWTVLATIPCCHLPTSVKITPDGTKAIVSGVSSYSAVVDLVSYKALPNMTYIPSALGAAAPRSIAVNSQGTQAAIVNGGNAGTTSFFNLTNNTESAKVVCGSQPYYVAFTPDGTKAVVPNNTSNNVTVINTSNFTSGTLAMTTPMLVAAISGSAKAAVISNAGSVLSIINVSGTPSLSGSLTIGAGINALAVTPDGTKALVVNQTANSMTIASLTGSLVGVGVSVGTSPNNVATNGSKAVVTCDSSDVAVINLSNNSVSRISGSIGMQYVAITPDGTKAVLAVNRSYGSPVLVADLTNNTIVNKTYTTTPTGVSMSPDGTKAAIVGTYTTMILNLTDFSYYHVPMTTQGNSIPQFSPDGSKLYWAHQSITNTGVTSLYGCPMDTKLFGNTIATNVF